MVATLSGDSNAKADDRFEALLGLRDEAEADPTLRDALLDRAYLLLNSGERDVPVRLVALRIIADAALDGQRVKIAVDHLSNHADKGEHDVWCRLEAIDDLGQIGELPITKLTVDDPARPEVVRTLVRALNPDVEPDRDVRIAAARGLARLHPDQPPKDVDVLGELAKALSDETPDVRYYAECGLCAMTGEKPKPRRVDWELWIKNQVERK
jgi:HEAT repeat protein